MLDTCSASVLPYPLLKQLQTLTFQSFSVGSLPNPKEKERRKKEKGSYHSKRSSANQKMGKKKSLLLLAFLVGCSAFVATVEGYVDQYGGEGEGGVGGEESPGGSGRFLLRESMHVVKTDAGEMKVIRGDAHRFWRNPMHMGLINMEPNSLFIPQYLDSSIILFIRTGEARVGHIQKDALAETALRTGDLYRIESGSAFYIVNTAEGQRLHIICSIDTSDNFGWQWNVRQGFQSYFVGGGTNPTSVLSGFDLNTISTALNVSVEECKELMTRQHSGPIIYLSNSHVPTMWSKFLELKEHQKLAQLKRIVHLEEDPQQEEKPKWSFRKLLKSFLGEEGREADDRRGGSGKGPDAYNIYDRKADFRNDYGWSKAVSGSDYSPLADADIGVYLVNLTAGSMLGPHINPRAIEYGVVLNGCGSIQIGYPNGTLAMNAEVCDGDAFWVPQYFPFCQIASRSGPFEFFGFTTSAKNNRPQFLVGVNSLLQNMAGPEFAAAFGITEEKLQNILKAQRESTIFPPASAAPPGDKPLFNMDRAEIALSKVIGSFGDETMTGFD